MLQRLLFRSFLQDGEEISFAIHKHIILAFPEFFRIIFFGLLLPAGMWLLFPKTLIFAAVWAWIGFMRLVYAWLDWYYDAWIITNISITHIEWEGFFKKAATRTEYHLITSVGYEVKGFWPTVLNYGTVIVEKETGNQMIFTHAACPRKRAEQMTSFHDTFLTQKNLRNHKSLKNILVDLLHHHSKTYHSEGETKAK